VYTGNVSDHSGQSTYCPGCGTRIIGRSGYELSAWGIETNSDHNTCRTCLQPIAGVFEPHPGTWGGQRQPVSIATC
jgi:pyruvate formate lyase activating enzyme